MKKIAAIGFCILLLAGCKQNAATTSQGAVSAQNDSSLQAIIDMQNEKISSLEQEIVRLSDELENVKAKFDVAPDPSSASSGSSQSSSPRPISGGRSTSTQERVVYVEVPGPCSCGNTTPSVEATMPELRGKTEAQAKAELDALGLQYQIDYYTNDKGVLANGTVQSTGPSAGEKVTSSTVIKLLIYKNFLMPDMSGYIGQSVETLTGYLTSVGVPYNPNAQGTVDTSDPNLGGKVAGLFYGVGVGVEVTADSPMLTFGIYSYVAPTPQPTPTLTPPPSSIPAP